jgi:rubrerythrin
MPDATTIGEVFDLAIATERALERLYLGLEARFVRHEDVAAFWKHYALEEAGHARLLRSLRDRLDPEQLAAPADPDVAAEARALLRLKPEEAMARVKTLDEAYELANELEHSETNAIFEVLLTSFSEEKQGQSFMRSQLHDHVSRLVFDFPEAFRSATVRRSIAAEN